MDSSSIAAAAEILLAARCRQEVPDDLPLDARPTGLAEGYAIQRALNVLLQQEGFGAEAGHKIGCTTPVMQDYMKIAHPCAGVVFAATVFRERGTVARKTLCRPGVECEIAVVLGRDMDAEGVFDATNVASCVAASMASIELVDERWTDFTRLAVPSLVADNFFNAGCVLGPATAIDPGALAGLEGGMRINGAAVGSGRGDAILGDPLAALAWLANHQRDCGRPLRAGQFVTLGSLVKTVWVEAGDSVDVDIAGLGHCRLELT